ncbi:MAG: hypothetical protein KDI56_13115, partial [Xanthomonadales bacterium]|nr:hypothetical protein [Xanthomonadales bacterium]
MSPAQIPDPDHDPNFEEEIGDGDDRIIGRAFRWSMVLLVAIVLLVAGGLGLRHALRTKPVAITDEGRAALESLRSDAAEPSGPQLSFADVTSQAGIDFVHRNGATGERLLPETMGSGV